MLNNELKLQIINTAYQDYRDKQQMLKKLEEELKETERVIVALWKYLDICPKCKGKKEYFSRLCAEDEGEVRKCSYCEGTGKFPESWCKYGVPQTYYNEIFKA